MRRLGFVLALLLSLVVLFTPESGVPTAPPGTDKIVHVLLFALLAVTGVRAGLRARWLLPCLVVYAGVSEVLQATLPLGRDGDVVDALVDVAGVLLGLAVVALAARRTARSGRPGT